MFLSSGLMEGGSTTGGGGTGGTGGPAREMERREKSRINYRRHERAMSAQASNFPLPAPPLPLPILLIREPLLLLPSSSSRPLPLLASFLPALPSSSHLVFMIAVLSPLWPFLSAPSLPSLSSPLSLHCYPSRLLSLPLCPPAKKISSSPSFRLSIPLPAFLPSLPLSSSVWAPADPRSAAAAAFNSSNKKTDGGGGGGLTSPAGSPFPLPLAPPSLGCRLSQPGSPLRNIANRTEEVYISSQPL